jgi:aspartyl/asparaginyl beta-hydroxylase (cupin superfamily)
MRLHKGQQVRVKTYKARPYRWNYEGKMDKYMGQIVTIHNPMFRNGYVSIEEDEHRWSWSERDFEPLKEALPDDLFEI